MNNYFGKMYTTYKFIMFLVLPFRNASARKRDWSRTVWCRVFLWILGGDWSMCREVCCTPWWQALEWPCNGVLLYKVGFSPPSVLPECHVSLLYLEFIIILMNIWMIVLIVHITIMQICVFSNIVQNLSVMTDMQTYGSLIGLTSWSEEEKDYSYP